MQVHMRRCTVDLPSRCTTNSHTGSSDVVIVIVIVVVVSYCLVVRIRTSMQVHMGGCAIVWRIYQAGAQQIFTQEVAKLSPCCCFILFG
jgi:hypothetical protein